MREVSRMFMVMQRHATPRRPGPEATRRHGRRDEREASV